MKADWYTKAVLTVIAAFLGVLVFDRHRGPAPAKSVRTGAGPFDGVAVFANGTDRTVSMFDKRTGE